MSDISHIGIAVDDLEQAIKIFSEILGYSPSIKEEVPDQKVIVAIFASDDDPDSGRIELLAATDNDSSIRKFIDNRGAGLHHLAVKVKNIEQKLESLKKKGFALIDEKPRIGAEGKKIAFIHPSATGGVMIELQE